MRTREKKKGKRKKRKRGRRRQTSKKLPGGRDERKPLRREVPPKPPAIEGDRRIGKEGTVDTRPEAELVREEVTGEPLALETTTQAATS